MEGIVWPPVEKKIALGLRTSVRYHHSINRTVSEAGLFCDACQGDSCPVQFNFLSFSAFFRSLDTPLWAVLSEKIPRRRAEPALELDHSSASRFAKIAGEGTVKLEGPDSGREQGDLLVRLAVNATARGSA
jgi:hypothetical protein